jgi:hypothetical protein
MCEWGFGVAMQGQRHYKSRRSVHQQRDVFAMRAAEMEGCPQGGAGGQQE